MGSMCSWYWGMSIWKCMFNFDIEVCWILVEVNVELQWYIVYIEHLSVLPKVLARILYNIYRSAMIKCWSIGSRRIVKIGNVMFKCRLCMLAAHKLGHKCKTVNPIVMRLMGCETRHQIGQLSCRNFAKILPRNWR